MRAIPFYPQRNDYYCGPATLQMVLAAFGIRSSQNMLAKQARTNQKSGTSTKNMVSTLKRHGLMVRAQNNQTVGALKRAMLKDSVVIVCYTEPILEWGHFAIVKKITDKKIFLIDSDARTGNTTLLLKEFKRRWRDPLFTKTVRWAAFVAAPKSPQR